MCIRDSPRHPAVVITGESRLAGFGTGGEPLVENLFGLGILSTLGIGLSLIHI